MAEAGGGTVGRGRHYLVHDGRSILPIGAHFVPVEGPDWPWRVGPDAFEAAFRAMSSAGLDCVRIDVLWEAVEPEPGRYDEGHLRALDAVLAAARRHGLWLHPALLIGGEVGDAFWDVPWRDGRHPHRDPEMLRLQRAHVAMLARRWRGDSAIMAWDLTDEPPFWLFESPTEEEARSWAKSLAEAIKAEDPDHLVTVGTAGQDVQWGPFRADVVADVLDFTCVHPYPIYQPELYPDSLLAPRMTHAAAFETALASGAGKPVMVHEFGASSAQLDPEAIAAYDRLLAWSSLGRGAIGFFAWCWADAEPAAYERAPYARQPHETQFGLTDWRGALRPRGRVLGDLAATARAIDLDAFASDGPAPPAAAMIVPHEYVHPYDQRSYGLSAGASGLYRPSESIWSPRRTGGSDVAPLVRAWLNGYVLAARADIGVAFVRESLDHLWPRVRLLLLPAPLASTTVSLWHVGTGFWSGALDFLTAGGILYLSCSADVAIPEMDDIAGCRLRDRAPGSLPTVLRFVAPWGPFRRGDELALPAGDGALATRGVRLAVSDGDPIAVDAGGSPALVIARRGAGRTVTCAFPVELLLAGAPDAHGPRDRSWGLYAGLAGLGGEGDDAVVEHPDVTGGTLTGPRGALVTVTNHGGAPVEVDVGLPRGTGAVSLVANDDQRRLVPENGRAPVALDAYGSAVLTCTLER